VRVQPAHPERLVVTAEAKAQERVLPLGVEVHGALDVDDHRLPPVVDEDVVRAKLAVDQGVLRAGRYRGGTRSQGAVNRLPGFR
jgi:hypothetical protein